MNLRETGEFAGASPLNPYLWIYVKHGSHDCLHMDAPLRNTLDRPVCESLGRPDSGRHQFSFRERFGAYLASLSNNLVWICFVSLGLVLLGSAWAFENADRFWSELGLSENPETLLRDILARREFKESQSASIIASLMRWLLELVARLLSRLFGKWNLDIEGEMVWTAIGAFFAVVLVAAALTGLFFAFKSWISRDRKHTEAQFELLRLADESSSKLLAASRSVAERAEYREALILLFRYSLVRLGEQGRLGFYAGRTNREILRSPHLETSDRKLLSEMIPIFNCVRYGNFPCGKAEYQTFVSLTTRLVGSQEAL